MKVISSRTAAKDCPADRIRPKEAAQIARVSVPLVYRWMHEGGFEHFEVRQRGRERGMRFIVRSSFLKFLEEQAKAATE
jgi:hypothetical protein